MQLYDEKAGAACLGSFSLTVASELTAQCETSSARAYTVILASSGVSLECPLQSNFGECPVGLAGSKGAVRRCWMMSQELLTGRTRT